MKVLNLFEAEQPNNMWAKQFAKIPPEVELWISQHLTNPRTQQKFKPNDFEKEYSAGSVLGGSSFIDGELNVRTTRILSIDLDDVPPPFKFGLIGTVLLSGKFDNSLFKYFPHTVDSLNFAKCELNSISGLSKRVKHCKEIVLCPTIKSGLLEAYKLNLHSSNFRFKLNTKVPDDLAEAVRIVKTSLDDNDSIFKCQQLLISAGLKDFAK